MAPWDDGIGCQHPVCRALDLQFQFAERFGKFKRSVDIRHMGLICGIPALLPYNPFAVFIHPGADIAVFISRCTQPASGTICTTDSQ